MLLYPIQDLDMLSRHKAAKVVREQLGKLAMLCNPSSHIQQQCR